MLRVPLLFNPELLALETYERRYYSRLCQPFAYEPMRDRISIIRLDSMGKGLQSLVNIAAGRIVFKFFGEQVSAPTLYSLQIEPGRHLADPIVMGKVLHDCDPNMVCDMTTLTFYARRNIRTGDLLTMDYESTEDKLFRAFQCQCGSPNCRGLISGRACVPADLNPTPAANINPLP